MPSRIVRSEQEEAAAEAGIVGEPREALARYPADEHLSSLIEDLRAISPPFAELWEQRPVVRMPSRHKTFLHPDYFAMLSKHGVAHIFNSWTHMPGVAEQMAMERSITNPALAGARFLLKPGRDYEEAVRLFKPYREVKEEDREARRAARQLIEYRIKGAAGGRQTYIFVNNRLEGNALATIRAMVAAADTVR
jgi:hypothetical protein